MKIKTTLNKYLNLPREIMLCIKNFVSISLGKLDIHTLEVVRKSSASTVVKVAGMAIGLGVSIFLGRTLGADGLGIINLSNRIVSLLLVFTMFGFDNVLIKHIAIAYENKNWQKIADNIFTSSVFNGLLAITVSLGGLFATPWLVENIFHEPELKTPLMIALVMIVPQTYSRIFAAGLKGFRKIWQSALVNETLSTWVLGFCLIILHISKSDIDVVRVAILYATGRIIVTTTIFFYWRKLFSFQGAKVWNLQPMLKTGTPLLLVSATAVIASNASIILLGWLESSKEVGLFSVAARIALLTSFILQVSNAAIAPKLASLFAKRKITEMRKMVQRVTGGLILTAFGFLLLFLFSGKIFLSLWGDEFTEAYIILLVLSIGQFFNISTGCTGLILIMCGFEKIQGYISLSFVCVNLISNYLLIKYFGAIGAAFATAITILGENIAKVIIVKLKTGILTIPTIWDK
ncbi:flippase [uncultured Draconibacterium sp.]|uniref:flippase n=1 Tax=uncultured Draconibacterium sp. TaxID=1573823 RepID=UPI0025DB2C70|nr:flippase [uncultured Draconibacterium sp.]